MSPVRKTVQQTRIETTFTVAGRDFFAEYLNENGRLPVYFLPTN